MLSHPSFLRSLLYIAQEFTKEVSILCMIDLSHHLCILCWSPSKYLAKALDELVTHNFKKLKSKMNTCKKSLLIEQFKTSIVQNLNP